MRPRPPPHPAGSLGPAHSRTPMCFTRLFPEKAEGRSPASLRALTPPTPPAERLRKEPRVRPRPHLLTRPEVLAPPTPERFRAALRSFRRKPKAVAPPPERLREGARSAGHAPFRAARPGHAPFRVCRLGLGARSSGPAPCLPARGPRVRDPAPPPVFLPRSTEWPERERAAGRGGGAGACRKAWPGAGRTDRGDSNARPPAVSAGLAASCPDGSADRRAGPGGPGPGRGGEHGWGELEVS